MSPSEPVIRDMVPADWKAVARIYGEGISSGNATFETGVPDWPEWDEAHHRRCRLVAVDGEHVLGWAALGPISKRPVYGGVAEASIYVSESARGSGVGSRLLSTLIQCSEQAGFWTLQAGIFPENEPSIRLHRRHGFRLVGNRERVGRLGDVWRDVLLLERRSEIVG